MYPTIGAISNFDAAVNPLHAPYPTPGSSSNSVAQPPAPQPRPAANGPPSPAAPGFATLQVMIDPRFHLAPPVRAPSQPPGEGNPAANSGAAPPPPPGHPAPGSQEPLDLSLERQLVQDLAPADGSMPRSRHSDTQGPEDPYDVLLGRYTGMGYSRDEVAMALTIAGPDHSNDADKIVDGCRKYRKLRSMGFRADHVAGALILHEGDLDAATNTCLDAT